MEKGAGKEARGLESELYDYEREAQAFLGRNCQKWYGERKVYV